MEGQKESRLKNFRLTGGSFCGKINRENSFHDKEQKMPNNQSTKGGKPPVYGRRNSATGGPGPRSLDMTNWRVKLMASRIKFDDERKKIFLEHFSKTSRVGEACQVAGVNNQTVLYHYKNDPDFAESYEAAKLKYRDSLQALAEDLIFNGVEKPIIGGRNKDMIIATTIDYPIPLLQMELKRVDPDYKDRQVVENVGSGAVVLIPAHMDPEQWIKEQMAKNEVRGEPLDNGEASK